LKSEDILVDLTEAQKEAVTHLDGPMLVVAGPGSGKTRVITRRVAWLISQGVPPGRILGLTFTNKAAEEMRTRLTGMGVAAGATLSTFHSLCARLLREFADQAGLKASFTIYDETDRKAALREACRESELDFQLFPPAKVLRRISRFKNQLQTPDDIGDQGFDLLSKVIKDYYSAYQKQLDRSAGLDFDDLLMRMALLLEKDSGLAKHLGERFRYILVDEYQDTNPCQYRIARKLAESHGNLFVTGDPDQSIYGWRGADISNILAFEKDWPQAKVVRLEFNFRSTPQVLYLADHLIKANRNRKDKRLIARKGEGEVPRLHEYRDESEEALGAVDWILEMKGKEGLNYGDLALFYRTNAMSRALEEGLYSSRIPYQIVRGLEFYKRREIKDVLAYLRVLVNPSDEVSLVRIVNRPARGIGAATLQAVRRHSVAAGCGLWPALGESDSIEGLGTLAVKRAKAFTQMMEGWRSLMTGKVADILKAIFTGSGLKEMLEGEKNDDAVDNVLELIGAAARFDEEESMSPEEYLRQLALLSDPDTFDREAGSVSLMTLHAAKGLEFPAVRIVGVEDGIIPHERSQASADGLEEERRLLFVGITRAEKLLSLSLARSRTVNGLSKDHGPSRFLAGLEGLEVTRPVLSFGLSAGVKEGASVPRRGISASSGGLSRRGFLGGRGGIPAEITEGPVPAGGQRTPKPTTLPYDHPLPKEKTADQKDSRPFGEGKRVHHPTLGPGRVEKCFSLDGKDRVIVKFDSGPRLNMDAKLANLKPSKG
jgi:DNA helicase-2/ATP-dependent DNA helicase PcrA